VAAEGEVLVPELPQAHRRSARRRWSPRIGAQVATLVDQQPEEVALLLRTWLEGPSVSQAMSAIRPRS
jgi:flagellar biosynthesis/type III secretory pathway M-ring protein FliF/YscJ